MADNKKSGKERGQNGKPRSRKQILAIAIQASKAKKDGKGGPGTHSKMSSC